MMLKLLLGVKRFKIRKIFNKRFSKEQELKLHLGCGTVYKTGWINIDNNSDNNTKHLDINWDLSKGIPFADNSVDYIFNEHLTVKEGQVFLKDCKRVLKKGGVLRIAMPDLEIVMQNYFNPNWRIDAKESLDKFNLNYIKTKRPLFVMIENAVALKPIKIWENPNYSKDMVYDADASQMLCKAYLVNRDGGMYNIGTGISVTLEEQIKTIIEVFSPKDNSSPIIYKPEKNVEEAF